MPTKRTFDLAFIVAALVHAAIAMPKAWAKRTLAERNTSTAGTVAGAFLQAVN